MAQFFTAVFVQPMLNLLVWLYDVVPGHDIGVAIILLTLIIKLILYPLSVAQIKQQRALQGLQPKIDEIRKRLKDDKDAQAKELMALYAKDKVNPAASCLPLLIQLPVLIGLYSALRIGLASKSLTLLYAFVPNPELINANFFGLFNLTQPSYVLAVLAAAVQFVQTRQILKPPAATVANPPPEVAKSEGAKDESMAAAMNKQMAYTMPIVTILIGIKLPGGLTLYWLVMSLLTVLQQWWLMRKTPPKITAQLSSPGGPA